MLKPKSMNNILRSLLIAGLICIFQITKGQPSNDNPKFSEELIKEL